MSRNTRTSGTSSSWRSGAPFADKDRAKKEALGPSWKRSANEADRIDAQKQAAISPIAEDEESGFTEVSRASKFKPKKTTGDYAPLSNMANSRINGKLGQASVASASSRMPYVPKKKTSGYKQSCLPKELQDPVLLAQETNRGVKLSKGQFRPGMIIRAPLHEQASDGGPDSDDTSDLDDHISDTKFGKIYTKYRKMIVLALFHSHYLAVPLYSHNGKGLENKACPDEYVSVKDHRRMGTFTPLSKHSALKTEHIDDKVELFHEKSTAHFTYLQTRSYHLPVVSEGRLETRSLKSLAELSRKYFQSAVNY